MAGNRSQHLASHRIGHVTREHLVADLFEFVVNAFQRVGRVLGVSIKQLEEHLFGIFNQTGRTARPHAQQPEHRNVFIVDGKQHTFAFELIVFQVQNEGDAHGVGFGVVGDQEVTADVQFAVVFLVKAR